MNTARLPEVAGTEECADQVQTGQSKGTAYVQFRELRAAQMALDAMNGFELAGRQSESHAPGVRWCFSEHLADGRSSRDADTGAIDDV